MNSTWMYFIAILIFVGIIFGSFYLGRHYQRNEDLAQAPITTTTTRVESRIPSTDNMTGKPIHDTIPYPVPIREKILDTTYVDSLLSRIGWLEKTQRTSLIDHWNGIHRIAYIPIDTLFTEGFTPAPDTVITTMETRYLPEIQNPVSNFWVEGDALLHGKNEGIAFMLGYGRFGLGWGTIGNEKPLYMLHFRLLGASQ